MRQAPKEEMDYKGHKDTFGSDGNVLHLDCGSSMGGPKGGDTLNGALKQCVLLYVYSPNKNFKNSNLAYRLF